MVVTGLHLLGGARADAHQVRSGSDRSGGGGPVQHAAAVQRDIRTVEEILESCRADPRRRRQRDRVEVGEP